MLADQEEQMAKKNKLTQTAQTIGAAMGRADRTAHKVAKASVVAKQELAAISKQVEALKKQLRKTTKRLKRALA
jgi:ribonuclease HII